MSWHFCKVFYLKALVPTLVLAISMSASAQIIGSAAQDLKLQLENNPEKNNKRVQLLNQLAYVHVYSDPISAMKFGLESKRLADSLHYTEGEAEACRQIALVYGSQADLSNAINYLLSGLRIAELNHHAQVEADITGNMGTIYNSMGNPKEALAFLINARKMQRRLLNRERESVVINNIGDSYFSLKEFDNASEAYTTALDYSILSDYKLGVATNLRNLGNILEAKGNYDSALVRYSKCIKLSEAINDHRGFILSHKSIASVYLKKKKAALAKQHALIALGIAVKERLRSFARDLYELMFKISETENDKIKTFEYFKLYVAYKDSVQNLKVGSEIATQRLHFESNKKEVEIQLLKKEHELQSEGIAIKNTQLIFAVVLSSLAITFLIMSVRSYQRIKIKNNELAEKNEEVNQRHLQIKVQHDELNTLNEELRSQQEEVMTQRDALAEKNREIEMMSKKITEVNEHLEQMVIQRTEVLEDQNTRLTGYAFLNAHKLRAPLARIMGLVNLLQMKPAATEKPMIMNHLSVSSEELNEVVSSISKTIQDEFNPDSK